jgi:hypothetical protein
LNMSQDIEEQPPRLTPANAIAMTRRMTIHFCCDEPPHNPETDLRSVVPGKQLADNA